jgi:prevent-host-death family protein
MAEISIRDLRNHGGEVVDRATRGEVLTITRSGKPVAILRGLKREPLVIDVVLERWRRLPSVDPDRLRFDLDQVFDPTV